MVDPRTDKRLLTVWVMLVTVTAGYLVLDGVADEGGTRRSSTVVTVVAIAVALAKIRIVLAEFMEVRHAPALLRRLSDLCVLMMAAALLGTYAVGAAVH